MPVKGEYESLKYRKIVNITILSCKTLASISTSWVSMSQLESSKVVSVYADQNRLTKDHWKEHRLYRHISKDVGKWIDAIGSNFIAFKY